MLYAGLDLSRQRLDVHLLDEDGRTVEVTAVRPDADALRTLVAVVGRHGQDVTAAIESMNGARFVHDTLELAGWDVAIADALKVKGPGAARGQDRPDRRLGAGRAQPARARARDLAARPRPSAPSASGRGSGFTSCATGRRSRTGSTPRSSRSATRSRCPTCSGVAGRELLASLEIPEPWATTLTRSLRFVDELDAQVVECEQELRAAGADHPDLELLRSAPGIGWVLGYTIASEIGDVTRFSSPKKLTGYTGLCPLVRQSGGRDDRGPLAKNGPKYLRWALIEAATHAARHPAYRERYERNKKRLGRQRGSKVARVDIARELATAIWYMLTKREPFAPGRPHGNPLVA